MKSSDLIKAALRKKRNWQLSRVRKINIFFTLAILSISFLGVRVLASRPYAARVENSSGSGNGFWLRRSSRSPARNVVEGAEMRDGGALSVPNSNYWASFSFMGGDQSYAGLIVKAYAEGVYNFPCYIEGHHIIGWSDRGGGQRACSSGANGIQISENSNASLLGLTKPIEMMARILNGGAKQVENQDGAQLSVDSGESQTLIRTDANENTSFTYVERCESWETPNGSGYRCETLPERNTSDSVDVEVFLGDVLIKSEESPGGVQVPAGQKYTYPGGTISPIDAGSEANSCEMLQFLNPGYWTSPDDSVFTEDPISEQLRQHREALGVSGRPANLSSIERGVVDEMNLARTNPRAYAEFLADRRRYFNGNRLELPGEIALITREGAAGYDNAIDFLRSTRPLPPLTASAGMSQAADDLANEQSSRGGIGHGSGSNSMTSRIEPI